MDYVEKFNSIFNELIDDLIRLYPDDTDFYMYKTALSAVHMIDSQKVCRGFRNHVALAYGDMIQMKNDAFFTAHTMTLKIDNESVIHFMSKLHDLWCDIQTSDKEVIWKYLRVLVILSKKANV